MKILSAKQIKALDSYTIAQGAIESIDLMDRACRAFFNWFIENLNEHAKVGVVCGTGNNGGDGLGIARLLKTHGFEVTCWIVKGGSPETGDFKINLERARAEAVTIFEIVDHGDKIFEGLEVIIDALFGSGLSRPLEGIYAWAVDAMNDASARRIAVDIPSGLMSDSSSSGSIVRADATISFQLPKLCFFLPQYHPFVGEWFLVDIGLNKNFIRSAESSYHYITQKGPRRILRKRSTFDHKGTFGHALMIAGSLGKMGAAVLSSRAALRSGLGLLTTHIPRCGNVILQTSVPEAMVSLDRNEDVLTSPPSLDSYTTIGIGPGLGRAIETGKALQFVLQHFEKPMVLDADALNIISERKELLKEIPAGSILTPHPKEFERLAGKWKDDFDRLDKLKRLASDIGAVVVLKGAFTSIASPEGVVCFNGSGNPGMATGGTGDVLTGILTGLLAQQYDPFEAAKLGVFLHGLAGDLAVPELGMTSLIASDIIDFLPFAFQKLRRD